ncbi:MAG: Asp-tRNA(Asn)/Glu-tRNA(Gln) amidotransferase subunit GatC [Sulfurovum sp.]|nr:MAG: Asp-tRNA(Asn)/Glu-tRNA(Gln) amidotransferase subunit GatC [Sulfurovum sp.]
MWIDDKVLEKLEKLSSLSIEESKREMIKEQLSEILSYVENLEELETAHLDASFSTLDGGTPFRADEVSSNPQIPADILVHAPNSSDDFFIVPKIIE